MPADDFEKAAAAAARDESGKLTDPPPRSPEDEEAQADAERRLRQALASEQSKSASRTFARLRLNVTHVSPGYVTCSLFQSDNAGTNWACVGTDVTFPDDWFRGVFGAADRGRRIEFGITGAHEVSE